MPTLFQGICGHCGHRTSLLLEGYGAVLVDRPVMQNQHEVAGAVVASGEGGSMASVGDPRFVVVRHPTEGQDLAMTGYTWRDLLKQGRYVRVTNVICGGCGTLFQRRKLAAPGGFGCATALASGFAAGLALGVWTRNAVIGLVAACLIASAVLVGAGLFSVVYLRLRFRWRAQAIASERLCPNCRADSAKTIRLGRSVTCPACQSRSLRFIAAGIS